MVLSLFIVSCYYVFIHFRISKLCLWESFLVCMEELSPEVGLSLLLTDELGVLRAKPFVHAFLCWDFPCSVGSINLYLQPRG